MIQTTVTKRNFNKEKVACKYGHKFTIENTRITKYGYRKCKQCERNRGPLKQVWENNQNESFKQKRRNQRRIINRNGGWRRSNQVANVMRWRKQNLDRLRLSARASYAVHKAIQLGLLTRPDICEECGRTETRISAAHKNYQFPLDVRWLCGSCHVAWDASEPKTLIPEILDIIKTKSHRNKNKTHCIRGHEFDEFNTYVRPNGGRMCRECSKMKRANH